MDLSLTHEPLTNVFTGSGICVDRYLNPNLVADFEKEGFVTGLPLLDEEQLEQLRLAMDDLSIDDPRFYEYHRNESKDGGRQLFHALGAWRVSPVFHDLLFYRPMIEIAEKLLGGAVRFWHDQVFSKPPHDGAVVAWHQDYSYWTRTVPLAHLTCWIGLDDTDEENGCVQYIPRSQHWHLLPRGDIASDMKAVLKHLNADQKDAFQPRPAIMKAGEASFHHSMTVHGSYENNSDRPRRGVVINFIRDGVRSNTHEPLLDGIPVIPMGDKLEGQFFPLLSTPA